MQFDGAVIREQGVTFAIAVVQRHIVENRSEAERAARGFSGAFPGLPVVLMGQDNHGRATYFGRPDIVNFLSGVSPNQIPWHRYTIN